MIALQRMLMTTALTVVLSSTAFAQDETQETPPFEPVVGAIQTFTVETADAAPMMLAAPIISAPMPMLGFTMNESEDYSFMHDPSVRKDLEFVDEQYEKFVELSQAHQKAVQELMPGLMKPNADGKERQKLMEEMNALQKQFQDSVGEVLLPHQRDRYKQVARQMKMQMVGVGTAMQHGFLAKELGITDGQKEKLQKIQIDLNKQLQEANKKLRAEAKEKALQVLTIKQRSQIEELIGDEFKHDHNDWREELENARPLINRSDTAQQQPDDQ